MKIHSSLKNSFSPRNGEVFLKTEAAVSNAVAEVFQSPQWGSNSKEFSLTHGLLVRLFQSPQWGSNSKALFYLVGGFTYTFQSPQWGSNSKGGKEMTYLILTYGFSPRNGEVILKGYPLESA